MLDISNFSGDESIDVAISVGTDDQGSNPHRLAVVPTNTGTGGVDNMRRAAGIFSSIAKVTIFIAIVGTLHPPEDLPSHKFLSATYYGGMILLFMLGLLLFALAYALSMVTTQCVPAVHFAARKLVESSLLLLLLLVASLGAYRLFVTGSRVPVN